MSHKKQRFWWIALATLLMLDVHTLTAQTLEMAKMSAVVVDPSGAPVSGAAVRLKAVRHAGSATQETATGVDGRFDFMAVKGVQYELTIDDQGFTRFHELATGGDTLAPIHLTVAGAVDSVDVDGSLQEAQVDAQETQSGATVQQRQLASLPLDGRGFTDALAITPGVVSATSAQPNAVVMSGVAGTPPSGDLNIGALSVSGQRETANAFRVNGSDVQEDVSMSVAIVPALDSIAELKVSTNSLDASSGGQSGGKVEVTTRAGTRKLHGSAYDYVRNTALDARNYFSQQRAPYRQNIFGGTLGGPVPRTSAVFFADYQGTRQTQGIDTGQIAVPTIEDRTGNLHDRLSSLTGSVTGDAWAQTLSQRLGYEVKAGEPYAAVFPNGVIPQRAWSNPARALLPYIPEPNLDTSTFGTSRESQELRDDKCGLRLDLPTPVGQYMLYGFVDDYKLLNPFPTQQGGANVPGFSTRNQGRAQLYASNLTTPLGAKAVNTAHVSYLRNSARVGQPVGGQGVTLTQQGFVTGATTPGIVAGAPAIVGVENVVFNSFTIGTTVTGLSQAENTSEVTDDFSHSYGRHLLTIGGAYHADQINTLPNVYDNGSFLFTGSETGLDLADFLLGIDTSYTQGSGRSFYNRNHTLGLYGQDSWRATDSLTFNYGVRWDVLPPWHEKYNQLLSLDPGEQSVVYPNAPKGILFPGDPGVARTVSPTRYMNITPRLASSWTPAAWSGRTTVRAGFGVHASAFEGLSAGIMSGNPPYGVTQTLPAPTLFDTPFLQAANAHNLGQRFPLQQVPFGATATHPNSTVDWSNFEPITGVPAFAKNNVNPYSEDYTFSLEEQVRNNTIAKFSYVGSQAHHLLVIQEVNPGDPAECLALSRPSAVAAGSATCGPFNESSTFVAANGAVIQGTRKVFPGEFGSVNLQKTIGNAHYNAFEASLRHSSRDAYTLFAYTWGKSIDQSSSLAEAVYPETAFSSAGLSRAISAFDVKHSVSAMYRYTLPLDARWHGHSRLTGTWQISGVSRFSTGFPVTLFNKNDTSLLGTAPNGINNNGLDEPQFAGGDLQLHHRPDRPAFATALFSLPVIGTLGNARRRFFYGPGMANTDLAVSKSTQMWDASTLELRVEAFNVFNHSQFFGPAAVQGNISAANFGEIQNADAPRRMQIAARFSF